MTLTIVHDYKFWRPKTAASVSAVYQILLPESFNFDQPEECHRWIWHFKCFRPASGLRDKSQESQVNSLIYAMGDEAEDILGSLNLTDTQ